MAESRRDMILAAIDHVEAMPHAASRALEALENPQQSLAALAPVIQRDPGLTAEILRIANSVAYAPADPIRSIQDAVVRLGFDTMKEVVVRAALGPRIRDEIRGYGLEPGELLLHSILVARGTLHLARAFGFNPPDFAYTAGLLHHVGKLVLGSHLELTAEPILRLAQYEHTPFEVAERLVLGTDHAEVGAALLTRWNFHADIVSVVRWHHLPEHSPGDRTAARLVHVADNLVLGLGVGCGIDGVESRIGSETIDALGYEEWIGRQVRDQLRQDREALRTDIGSGVTTAQIATRVTATASQLIHPKAPARRRGLLALLGFR